MKRKYNQNNIKELLNKLGEDALPTYSQKEKMLNHILYEGKLYDSQLQMTGREKKSDSIFRKALTFISHYPWRFALIASTLQTALFTLLLGTKYTNFILGFLGGR